MIRRSVPILLVAALTACGPGENRSTTDDPSSAAGPVSQDIVCAPEDEVARGASITEVRRLSRDELALTLRDLLGDDVYEDAAIAPRVDGLPSDRTKLAGDFALTHPVGWAGVLSQIARRVGDLARTDLAWRSAYLHPCAETAPVTDDCVLDVVETWGARVWRRPLTSDEIDDYAAFHTAVGGGDAGLGLVVRRLLQSPSLAFHLEDGTGDLVDGRLRLTDHEVASRISYLTTGGPPDAALYEAADAGELQTVAQVRAHVERLLEAPEGRARVSDFFRYYTHLSGLPDPPAAAAIHAGVDPDGLGEALRAEAFAFFDDLVYSGRTYADLMTSTTAHPPTVDAARVLGGDAAGVMDAPYHPGLLHRPALLMSFGDRTSPILRGAHARKLFLCDALGLPDPEQVAAAEAEVGDTSDLTNREAVAVLTAGPGCVGCHNMVNPLGFLFEGYDQVGVPRTEEHLLDDEGRSLRTFPIDTFVAEVPLIEPEPLDIDGSMAFVQVLADNAKARQCLGRRMFEYYRRAEVDRDLDRCALSDIDTEARDRTLRDALVATIANADLFWKEEPR